MRSYETTILIGVTAFRADADGTLATVRGLYETEGVQFSEFGIWEERKLAYPIAGQTHAIYVTGYFTADPVAITRVERRVTLNELVLRHLIIVRDGPDLAKIKDQRAKAVEAAIAAAAAREAALAAEIE